jgi:hypothetical protein
VAAAAKMVQAASFSADVRFCHRHRVKPHSELSLKVLKLSPAPDQQ